MGRWSQARRAGGAGSGVAWPELAAVEWLPNEPNWDLEWSSGPWDGMWYLEIDRWISSDWFPQVREMLPGNQSVYPSGFATTARLRARLRPAINGNIGPGSDWIETGP